MKNAYGNDFMEALKNRLSEDQRLLRELARQLGEGAEERLEIMVRNGHPRYYSSHAGVRKYLKKSQVAQAEWLASVPYYLQLQAALKGEEKALLRFLQDYRPNARMDVYDKLSPLRKELVRPLIPTDEQFIAEWRANCAKAKAEFQNTHQKPEGFLTMRGEQVRSKSEKIIADLLDHYHIPYEYENPCRLIGRVVFPDFTLLDMKKREIVLLEHLGFLNDPDYMEKWQVKFHYYIQAGYIPGENLIITSETTGSPLNISDVEILLSRFL